MKSRFFLLSVFLLAGCQTIETPPSTTPSENQNVTPPSVAPDSVEQVLTTPEAPITPTPSETPKIEKPVKIVTPTKPVLKVSAPKVLTPQTQKNLWNAIAMQIDLGKVPDDPRIDYYRQWYLKNPEQLRIVAERAKPFLYYITQQVEKRHLPLELALLPIVESSFDQFAYSQSNAGGLWQIIPATGRQFGLTENQWYDGRFDVIASTNAALDLLEYLHDKLGSWPLALAAYNCGEGRVFRAIRENKQEGLPTNFWALSLPRETSDYVPKLYAVAQIIKNPSIYKADIPVIANQPVIKEVDPGVQMDLAVAARYAGLSLQKLQDLNPAYKQWLTGPKQQSLLLPIANISKFERNFANHKDEGVSSIKYTVQAGDSLSQIAEKYRTTSQAIRLVNNLKGNTIVIGQKLRIPTQQAPVISSTQATPKIKPQGKLTVYTVQKGDDLWTIAQNYHVSLNDLLKWSNLDESEPLRLGQKLNIWQPTDPKKDTTEVYYTVKSGDTLSGIAQAQNVSVQNLVQWNDLNNQRQYLQIGEKLRLFKQDIEKNTNTTTQYRVQSGDSLWSIAHNFNLNIRKLAKWNRLGEDQVLQLGEVLRLTPPQ